MSKNSRTLASISKASPIEKYRREILKKYPKAILSIIIEADDTVTVKIEGHTTDGVKYGVKPDKETGTVNQKILYALKSIITEILY